MSNAAVFAFLTLLYSCRVSLSSDELTRNYASNECGAKIIAANPEAQGTFKILSDARDEYMLNPCKAKIWFVVELCEPIQPSAIELANFELYSSTPKEIQIQGSDKYPSQEWHELGSFEASESRELQRFEIKSQTNYMKFIRISLHSHYGSEHYCPVSLIRAFGISLAEEFDTIESGGAPVAATGTMPAVAAPPLLLQPVQHPHQQPPPDQVLTNESVNEITSGSSEITGTTDVPLSELTNKASGPDELLAVNPAAAADNLIKQETGCQESDILLGERAVSSCKASDSNGHDPVPSPTPTVDQILAAAAESILSPTPVLIEVAEINSRISSTVPVADPADIQSDAPISSGDAEQTSQFTGIDNNSGLTVSGETIAASGTTAVVDAASQLDQVMTSVPLVSPTPPESAESSVAASLSPQPSPEPAAATGQVVPPVAPSPPPPSPAPPVVLQGPAHVMNESSTGSVIAASSSKESIFIRLNNRIKALELNMSLNREAIESIARRQEIMEHRMNDLFNRTQIHEEEGQRLIIDLQLKLNDISEQVYLLVSEKEVFHWQLIQVHIFLMVIEIAIIIMIMNTFMKKILAAAAANSLTPSLSPSSSCHQLVESDDTGSCQVPVTPSRSGMRSRSSPEKGSSSGLIVEHHPITGTALFKKKKRKKRKKSKLGSGNNQENLPPPPPSPVLAQAAALDGDHHVAQHHQPHLLLNSKIADIG